MDRTLKAGIQPRTSSVPASISVPGRPGRSISNVRRRKMERTMRLSRLLMHALILAFVCASVFVAVEVIDVLMDAKRISDIRAEQEILIARIDNLTRQYSMETRSELISQRAENMLGMYFPEKNQRVYLDISPDSSQNSVLLSAR